MKTLLKWFFRALLGIIVCLVIIAVAVIFLKIPINLTRFKEPVEVLVSKALHRNVELEGSVVISTSLRPVFTMQGLKVHNPDGFSKDYFLHLGQVKVQVALLPLLKRKVHIPEFNVEQLDVILEEKTDGSVNWLLGEGENNVSQEGKAETGEQKVKNSQEKRTISNDTIVVENLLFKEIKVLHFTPDKKEPNTFDIRECVGSMVPGEPLKLDMKGELLSFPYVLDVSVASLEEFLTQRQSWMDFQFEIAETNLSFSGNVDVATSNKQFSLETKVTGKSLSSLNDLLKVDLPPFVDYSTSTKFTLQKGRFNLENLTVKTGESSLVGAAEVIHEGDRYVVDVQFTSPLVQLDDFLFDDWSWRGSEESGTAAEEIKPEEQVGEQEKSTEQQSASGANVSTLLDPELLSRFNIAVNIRSEKVLSGEDFLGNGQLNATLKDGRIAVNPLEFHIPGGGITVSTSFKPDKKSSEADFQAKIENFDIGILVRRSKPEAKMAGLVNLDINLESSAATPEDLFANGNGYFDFSGHLNDIGAGIIDLWAVNLVAAIVSSTDENQSEINCAVGRWSVADGVLTPDVFFIDTSKIRICGKGKVDFSQQKIDVTVGPTPKSPEFFNLATPIRINGTFDDINFGLQHGAIIGTALKFITSPVHVPIRRLVSDDIPKDGNDACSVVLGPENRIEQSVRGCN